MSGFRVLGDPEPQEVHGLHFKSRLQGAAGS